MVKETFAEKKPCEELDENEETWIGLKNPESNLRRALHLADAEVENRTNATHAFDKTFDKMKTVKKRQQIEDPQNTDRQTQNDENFFVNFSFHPRNFSAAEFFFRVCPWRRENAALILVKNFAFLWYFFLFFFLVRCRWAGERIFVEIVLFSKPSSGVCLRNGKFTECVWGRWWFVVE